MPSTIQEFLTDKNNPVGWMNVGVREFLTDSRRLLAKCSKPDGKEFKKIASACAIGFGVMGFIGYAVKLVFIPINNILVGAN